MSLEKAFDIPRKPAPAAPATKEDVVGGPTTGKRKRDADETEEQEPVKRVAKESFTNGDGGHEHPIVLDDSGAILIDD